MDGLGIVLEVSEGAASFDFILKYVYKIVYLLVLQRFYCTWLRLIMAE
jgi:hypothetical protein